MDQLSAGRVLSLGWVNDADADGYPDMLVHERPTRGVFAIIRDWWTSSSTRASWVRLRSGRTGEVVQQMFASGESNDTIRAPYGTMFQTGKLGAWRVVNSSGVKLTDGSQSFRQVRSVLGGLADWTKHPETSELIRTVVTKSGVDLIGNDLKTFAVSEPNFLQTKIWTRRHLNGKDQWVLMLGFSLADDAEDGHSLVFIDWENRQIIGREKILSSGDLADHNGDGIDEIALTGNFKASTWLALKFSESAKAAFVLDGATGELLKPQHLVTDR